ncbi:MAG: glycosyltransferase family 2 protein [Halioglobus sp.]
MNLKSFLPNGEFEIADHRDRVSFDVRGLRRGLYFLRLEYIGQPLLVGPRVEWQDDECEGSSEVYLFEAMNKSELFGTVLLTETVHSLHFYPSRLQSAISFKGASIRPITEFARENIYGVPYVQYKLFGLPWLANRFFQDAKKSLLQVRGGKRESGYAEWWRSYSRCSESRLEEQRTATNQLTSSPIFSIVLPTYSPDMSLLRLAVESVKAQTYSRWQLCICDDASNSAELTDYLSDIAAKDDRIRFVVRESNGHISAATNDALEISTGSYVGFLDHDDELAPNALYEVALAIKSNPQLDLIYSDEDIVSEAGIPINGHFKPDWNQDLFRSINYVCHFLVVRRDLLVEKSGLREGFEGAQDFDLILRLTEDLDRSTIHHIPKVLYHWRAARGSTALDGANKPYAAAAGVSALGEHLERMKLNAVAEHSEINTAYRVRYQLVEPAPSVSIIVPTHNNLRVLRNCVRSVLELTDYSNFELLIVDNRSDDVAALEFLADLEAEPSVRVLTDDRPFNFSAINNSAVAESDAEIIVLLNNDTEVLHADWLTEMVSQAMREQVGAVGAKLLYPNNRIQHAGVLLGLGSDEIARHAFKGRHKNEVGSLARTRLVQEYCAVTGACLAVKREKYLAVGGLDEKNLAVAFNDIDFCLKLRAAGYQNIWTPYAQLYHYESYTRGSDAAADKIERYTAEADYMRKRWAKELKEDPYYNPSFRRDQNCFELAWPPFHED